MGLTVGGDTAWRVHSRGEIACAYHWIKGEPAMVLFPTSGFLRRGGAIPYVLPLSAAHELVKDGTGGGVVDSVVLWTKACRAAIVMGFGEDFHVAKRCADVILTGLDDLCDMPPEAAWLAAKRQPAPTGEIAFKVAGETVFQGEA
jgi:hypothetical protein